MRDFKRNYFGSSKAKKKRRRSLIFDLNLNEMTSKQVDPSKKSLSFKSMPRSDKSQEKRKDWGKKINILKVFKQTYLRFKFINKIF